MALYAAINPYPTFTTLVGVPLSDGEVFIGVANDDPEINPVPVWWDAAGTDAASQPLETMGGYIVRSGAPAEVYVDGAYSIRVRNRQGVQLFYEPNVSGFPVDLASAIGSGLIGFAQNETYPALSLGRKLQQFINPCDAPFNAVGDGSANDQAAILAADVFAAALGAPLFLTKTHRIAGSITLQSDLFFIGGKLAPTAGNTITCRGIVSAPLAQIFTGAGTVVGIQQVRPEWFGAKADDPLFDNKVAFQAAHDCVEGSIASRGGAPTIEIGEGEFFFGSTWEVRPTADVSLRIIGQGAVLGSRLTAMASFTGTRLLHIRGSADSIQQIANYEIGDFSVYGSPSTTCTIGVAVGSEVAGEQLIGVHQSTIRNVYVENFTRCWKFGQMRLCYVDRCSGWSKTIAGAVPWLITLDNPGFTGDLTFNNCQGVVTTGTNRTVVRIEHDIEHIPGSQQGEIKGIGFDSFIGYHADYQCAINAENGAQIGDIWFYGKTQFDGPFVNGFLLHAEDAGSLIDNVQLDGIYMRGGSGVCLDCFGESDGKVQSVKMRDSWVANCAQTAVFRGSCAGCDIINVESLEAQYSGPLIDIQASCRDMRVADNTLRNVGAATVQNMIRLVSGADGLMITNNLAGYTTLSGSIVLDGTSGNTKTITGNIARAAP